MSRWSKEHKELQAPHRLARVLQMRAPGFGGCLRCQRPWRFVVGHTTMYDDQRGCFPLCEECWKKLGTPEARLPYYRALAEQWLGGLIDYRPETRFEVAQGILEQWPLIEAAVFEEAGC